MTNGGRPTAIRTLLVKQFTEESAEEIKSSYDEWKRGLQEERIFDWTYEIDGDTHVLLIFYTE